MRNLLLGLSLILFVSAYAQTGEKNFIDQNYIEVTGKSEMEITPDLIYLKILINEKDNKNKISVEELEKQMAEKLKELGIDISKDLLVKDISSNFKTYLLAKSEIILSKEFQVIVHNPKIAGQVFIELEKIGISNITVEKLDNTNMIQYLKEVKINAIKAAHEKAKSLTNAINQEIGRALYIKEIDKTFNQNISANAFYVRGPSLSKKTNLDLDFEKIKLEYSILCKFELK